MLKITKRPDAEFTVPLKEAAERIGLAEATVIRRHDDGSIEGRQFGFGARRPWWFHPDDIAWLKSRYPQTRKVIAASA